MSKNIYGNTLEALIGAIYIDKGVIFAEEFIIKNIYNAYSFLKNDDPDYKSKLLKKAQKEGVHISYAVTESIGPDHNKFFFVQLMFDNKKIAKGSGKSIKNAEQNAAKKAYSNLF